MTAGLLTVCDILRGRGLAVVLVRGVFDVLSHAHAAHLRAARSLGDVLVATVTPDRHVGKPGRPIFPESERLAMVDAIRWVDYAVLSRWPTAVETIMLLAPAVYAKGPDYRDRTTPALEAERAAVERFGGRLVITSGPQLHTTEILERLCASR